MSAIDARIRRLLSQMRKMGTSILVLPFSIMMVTPHVAAECLSCPVGFGLNNSFCAGNPTACMPCPNGTFNDKSYMGPCRPSQNCTADIRAFRPGAGDEMFSPNQNTLCGPCLPGSSGVNCTSDDPEVACPPCYTIMNPQLQEGWRSWEIAVVCIGIASFIVILGILFKYGRRMYTCCMLGTARKSIQVMDGHTEPSQDELLPMTTGSAPVPPIQEVGDNEIIELDEVERCA